MKIGLVGYQGSGKSTLFEWLTETPADPSLAHQSQSAMAPVPEPRVAQLCEVYHPKKITLASLEVVDTSGLSRTHEGSAQRLALIREAGCLVVVVAAFGGADPVADLANFEDDLLIADLDIVAGRVERLRDQVRRPRPNQDELKKELVALEPIHEALEANKRLTDLTPEQQKATRSFQLFSEKPRLILVNLDDDESDPHRFDQYAPEGVPMMSVSLSLALELAKMDPEERQAFCEEMQVEPVDRDPLVRGIMDASNQMLFFTAGEKEVRTWMLPKGGTAQEAAGGIHTDMAKGFIRAETMKCDDLIRLGSEREVKAANLHRQEPKDYVIQDGDVINIRHN